jgi:hypothetical protein
MPVNLLRIPLQIKRLQPNRAGLRVLGQSFGQKEPAIFVTLLAGTERWA